MGHPGTRCGSGFLQPAPGQRDLSHVVFLVSPFEPRPGGADDLPNDATPLESLCESKMLGIVVSSKVTYGDIRMAEHGLSWFIFFRSPV